MLLVCLKLQWMTREFPPRFTCGFGRNHSSQIGSGSHKFQMLRNKTDLPVFFMPANYRPYAKMGPSWTVTVHFFIHWVSVLYCHCGAFPGAGKCWISLGWKSFLSDRKVMRKTIIALGSGLTVVWLCPLAPAETGWAVPADIPSINLTQQRDRQTSELGSIPQPFDSQVMKMQHLLFLKIICYKYCIWQRYSPEKACMKVLLWTKCASRLGQFWMWEWGRTRI